MFDPIYEALDDIFSITDSVSAETFEKLLAEYGYMIVPIDDPTNLFGVQDDD